MEANYYFYNETRSEHNQRPIPGYNTLYVKNFDQLNGDKGKEVFESVAKVNGWATTDVLEAIRETSYGFAVYANGSITWEIYGEQTGDDSMREYSPRRYPIMTDELGYDSIDDPEVKEPDDYDW